MLCPIHVFRASVEAGASEVSPMLPGMCSVDPSVGVWHPNRRATLYCTDPTAVPVVESSRHKTWLGYRTRTCLQTNIHFFSFFLQVHKRSVVDAGADDTIRTIIYTGRPMRARRDDINTSWEEDRQGEIKALATKGVIPAMRIWKELEAADAADPATPNDGSTQARVQLKIRPLIMGQAAGAIGSVLPAKQIIDEMVAVAVERIKCAQAMVVPSASL